MPRPFVAPRPVSHAPVTRPVGDPGAVATLPGPRPGGRFARAALTLRFVRDTPRFLMDLRRENGEVAAFPLRGEQFIALFAPAMVNEVLVAQQHAFVKGVGFARMRKVLGEGLLTNEEPIHLRHRRMMQAPFHP